ncbi:helix-turn-helix transcriptional regulator [Mucilaginibacter yixingensis]|nr:helix-turn-helix transcriptional regulator [Mucilaginibacter yixingensis]
MPIRKVYRKCAANLRRIRDERQFSIEALAVLSGVEESEIRSIESGVSDSYIESLIKLAETLNVDVCCLLIDPDCCSRW